MSKRTTLFLMLLLMACGGDSTEPEVEAKATTIERVWGVNQSGTVGVTLQEEPAVRVLDQNGQPMPGVTVVWSVAPGDGSVDPASAETDAAGTAATKWTLGPTARRQSLTATAANLPAVVFHAEAAPGTPAALEFISGVEQLAIAGDTVLEPIVVRVDDQFGNAVPGVKVFFSVTGGSGSVTAEHVATSTTGTASTRVAVDKNAKLNQALTLQASVGDVKVESTFRVRRPVLLFIRENDLGYYQVFAMDWIAGTEVPLTTEDEFVGGGMDISPDGTTLVISVWNPHTRKYEIQIRNLATGEATSVYSSPSGDPAYPRFSPGGGALTFTVIGEAIRTVATYDLSTGMVRVDEPAAGITSYSNYANDNTLIFSAAFGQQYDLMVRSVEPGTNTRLTSTRGEAEYWPAMLPGSNKFVFVCAPLDGNYNLVQRDLCAIDLDGSNPTKILDAPEWNDTYPTISHDGKYLVFASSPISGAGVSSIYYAPASGGNVHPVTVTTSAHETYPIFGVLGSVPNSGGSATVAGMRNATVERSRPPRLLLEANLLTVTRIRDKAPVLAHPGRVRSLD